MGHGPWVIVIYLATPEPHRQRPPHGQANDWRRSQKRWHSAHGARNRPLHLARLGPTLAGGDRNRNPHRRGTAAPGTAAGSSVPYPKRG